MLKEYIKIYFDFCYEEKILKGRSPAQALDIIKDMHEYIDNSIDGDLDLSKLKTINFSDMGASKVVKEALYDAFSVFEKYYEEEE